MRRTSRVERDATACTERSDPVEVRSADQVQLLLLTDNHPVDNTLKVPLWSYVIAVVFFPAIGIMRLPSEGH